VERIDIEMTVDMEDVTEKATYQKIKDYVKEKYGLNVHTKYIAEVKRKHGLAMHEAPNKVDVPKREYPTCPEEKVKVIEEALRYFAMIEV
jgi:actin-like ATPase involved in cell morphogenesis